MVGSAWLSVGTQAEYIDIAVQPGIEILILVLPGILRKAVEIAAAFPVARDLAGFGLATGRALGSAVERNRVRRRLREALRVMAPSFQPGWDVLIIARPAIVAADHEAVVTALGRLLGRAGVLGGREA